MGKKFDEFLNLTKKNTFINVTGNADDLLQVSNNGEMKQTRLFYFLPDCEEDNEETFDICITSTNPHKRFPIFDKLLGKKIRVNIEILD